MEDERRKQGETKRVRRRERATKEGAKKQAGSIHASFLFHIIPDPPTEQSLTHSARIFSLHYRCPPPPHPLAHIWLSSCLFPASPPSPHIISICTPSLHSSLCSQALIASVCFLYNSPASITCNALGSCPNTAIQPDVPSDSMPPPLSL